MLLMLFIWVLTEIWPRGGGHSVWQEGVKVFIIIIDHIANNM